MGEDHVLSRIEHMIDNPAAVGLLTLMHDISEDHYCAGWMSGLEYSLWRIARDDGDPTYGFRPIPPERVEALRWLSKQASGWWVWDDAAHEEKFIPLHEWRPMYKRWAQERDRV